MKIIALHIQIVVYLFIGITLCAQNKLVEKGDHAYKMQLYNTAAGYYLKALESGNVFHDAYLLNKKTGDCYHAIKKYELASLYYEKYLKAVTQPDDEVRLKYANMLLNQGKVRDAKEQFSELLKKNPGNEELKRMIACCNFAEVQMDRSNYNPVTNLEHVNSPQSEFGLALYDGNLVFSSNRLNKDFTTINESWGLGFSDIYMAGFDPKLQTFTRPGRLKGDINSAYHDGTFTFSSVTQTAYLTRCGINRDSCTIYQARYEKKRWVELKPVPIGDKKYNYAHPSLSSDGKTLYFTSDMPGGKGGKDIWMATVTPAGKIINTRNLSEINTSKDEVFPFILGDSVLFFASEGHIGMGGLDIFFSRIQKNHFANPINPGSPVNSTGDDFSIVLNESPDTLFFCSNREAGSNDDIYSYSGNIFKEVKTNLGVDSVQGNPAVLMTREEPLPVAVNPVESKNSGIPGETSTVKKNILPENMELVNVVPEKFFRVQIVASSRLVNTPVQFSGIEDMIDTYGLSLEKVAGLYKYRIGNFETRQEAVVVQELLRKRGYRDCFIVQF
jgi:tetratricopeptide (TPR) repeat protein